MNMAMKDKKFPMTPAGFEKLQQELAQLKTHERPAIIAAIADARRHGDLSENAEYHAAKEKQKNLERRISDIELKLASAEVIIPSASQENNIVFGATIHLEDLDTEKKRVFQIVGEEEADISLGRISVTSPLARGLLGKTVDEEVDIQTPGGLHVYRILKISYDLPAEASHLDQKPT